MCRLLGVLSNEPLEASFLLEKAPHSLLTQSHSDRKRKQREGWGIGWFEGGHPCVYKSPHAIYQDIGRLRRAGRRARGRAFVGHVRWASNPLKLPKHQLMGLAHTQPFVHGRWLFAHNGTLYIPREVTDVLGSWAKYIKGRNDSEVLFYWLMKHLPLFPSSLALLSKAVRAALDGLHEIWQSCKARYPLYPFPYHGLNWVLTNGRVLMAFCYVNPQGFGKTKALCHPGQPYYQLHVQRTAQRVTVASEPLTLENDWRPLRHGELLMVQKTAHALKVHRAQII